MTADERFRSDRFPRASRYHPEWIIGSASGGANSLWLTEWLAEALDLKPGMRVLDLGCGCAASSIFLYREFGVQVWATDLWNSASQNLRRIRDAGVESGVFPIQADARSLPFAAGFFDAVVSIDSFVYYGTDDLYLSYLARLVKPGGPIGIAGAGLMQEIDGPVPDHLQAWWEPALWCLHSPAWWRRHWIEPVLSAWNGPTRCPTDGSGGWTGIESSARRIAWRSMHSKRMPAATLATCASWAGGSQR
jgi:SAM-dependent methyltransferase